MYVNYYYNLLIYVMILGTANSLCVELLTAYYYVRTLCCCCSVSFLGGFSRTRIARAALSSLFTDTNACEGRV